jgi:hypothetical protein
MDPDPDPTPDLTPFFIDFKDGKKYYFKYLLFAHFSQKNLIFC